MKKFVSLTLSVALILSMGVMLFSCNDQGKTSDTSAVTSGETAATSADTNATTTDTQSAETTVTTDTQAAETTATTEGTAETTPETTTPSTKVESSAAWDQLFLNHQAKSFSYQMMMGVTDTNGDGLWGNEDAQSGITVVEVEMNGNTIHYVMNYTNSDPAGPSLYNEYYGTKNADGTCQMYIRNFDDAKAEELPEGDEYYASRGFGKLDDASANVMYQDLTQQVVVDYLLECFVGQYDAFTYDEEQAAYVLNTKNLVVGEGEEASTFYEMVVTVKNGALSSVSYVMPDEEQMGTKINVSNIGETVVEIPQAVVDNAPTVDMSDMFA